MLLFSTALQDWYLGKRISFIKITGTVRKKKNRKVWKWTQGWADDIKLTFPWCFSTFFRVLQSNFYDKAYHSTNVTICLMKMKYTVKDPNSWLHYLTQHGVFHMKQNILELSSKIPIETSMQEEICHLNMQLSAVIASLTLHWAN